MSGVLRPRSQWVRVGKDRLPGRSHGDAYTKVNVTQQLRRLTHAASDTTTLGTEERGAHHCPNSLLHHQIFSYWSQTTN